MQEFGHIRTGCAWNGAHVDNNAAQEELQGVRQQLRDALAEVGEAHLELFKLREEQYYWHTYARTSTTNAYEVLKRRGMQTGT
jgi:phage shock protein A